MNRILDRVDSVPGTDPVQNSYGHECCPLCSSCNIVALGRIDYEQPVIYSTHPVKLDFLPELWTCRDCVSWFTQNIFFESHARKLYSEGNAGERWVGKGTFESQKPRAIVDFLRNICGTETKLLDVGCNTGELLDFANRFGCSTCGVEFSSASRATLCDKGHRAYACLENVSERFDVITAFDLVEHLYDVPEFFHTCWKILNAHGLLVILTGNISSLSARLCKHNWWYLKYPEHIVFPSYKFYRALSGFRLINWIPTYVSLPYQQPPMAVVRGVIGSVVRSRYCGLPSIGPDHALIVLQK